MGTINMNGRFIKSARNVSIINGKVIIDGTPIETYDDRKNVIEVKIVGDIEKLECDCSVTVEGSVGAVQCSGSVHCNNVSGDVQCGGSVHCGEVSGQVFAGGSVHHS